LATTKYSIKGHTLDETMGKRQGSSKKVSSISEETLTLLLRRTHRGTGARVSVSSTRSKDQGEERSGKKVSNKKEIKPNGQPVVVVNQ
jgi:hypothetical protein